jgi:hypothetical protein
MYRREYWVRLWMRRPWYSPLPPDTFHILSLYIISLVLSCCGRPFHPSVPSSIHPSSSSRKKKMTEEEEEEKLL